ncbi:hypothetical protein BKA81DRAFT_367155 [Phyllosticta paracitricarpa]
MRKKRLNKKTQAPRSPTASALAVAPRPPASSETAKNATTSGRRSKLERIGTVCFGPGAVAATKPTTSAAGLHARRCDAIPLTAPTATPRLSRQRVVRGVSAPTLANIEAEDLRRVFFVSEQWCCDVLFSLDLDVVVVFAGLNDSGRRGGPLALDVLGVMVSWCCTHLGARKDIPHPLHRSIRFQARRS